MGKLHGAKGGVGRVKRVFISHPYKDDPKGNKKRVDTTKVGGIYGQKSGEGGINGKTNEVKF